VALLALLKGLGKMLGKNWYESKTIWGGIITAVCGLLAVCGHVIPSASQSALTDSATQIATAIATVVGSALAIYGRLKADKVIK
jgi:hypothetical protein